MSVLTQTMWRDLMAAEASTLGNGTPSRLISIAQSAVADLRGGDLYGLKVSLDSTLQNDLGLDSLARVELLHRVEEALHIRLPDDTFASAATLRDLLSAIERVGVDPANSVGRVSIDRSTVTPSQQRPDTAATLIEALRWHVERHASAAAITVISADGKEPITYAALWQTALAVCGALQTRGIVVGDAVALMLPTGAEYFTAFMGVLLCGGVAVPIYPPAEAAQLEEHIRRHAKLLTNAQVVAMLTDESARGVGRLLQANVPCLRRVETTALLLGEGLVGKIATVSGGSLALLQYTSGSTGDPKGTMLTHAQLLANIRAMGRAARIENTDVLVSWLPLYHDMGLIGAWLGTLYFGVPLIVMSPLLFLARPERWLWAIHQHRGTLSAAPNFAYEMCVRSVRDADIAGLDLSTWRVAFSGSEAVLPETLDRFYTRFAHYGFRREALAPVYGLAECAVGLSFPPLSRGPVIDRIAREPFTRSGEARPAATAETNPLLFVSCGLPLPGYEIRIVDANQRELGERQEGRLEFKGPSATQGYFDNPVATARLIRDGWLDSGDRAYVANGEIFITGRIKDIVIRGGRHIHPDEIEAGVGKVDGIRMGCVAAFGTRSAMAATERLIIMAETGMRDPAARTALSAKVTTRVVEVLGEPPDEVILVPLNTVLKTPSGKIRRAACREAYETGTYRGSRSAFWRQFLGVIAGSIGPMSFRLYRSATSIFYAGYFWSVVFSVGACTWLLVALLPRRSWAATVARAGVRGILRLVRLPMSVRGCENIPKIDPCVIVPNHSSYLDGLVVLGALRRDACFVAKRELFDQFIPRVFLNRIGVLFVARDESVESVASADAMTAAVRAGEALVVFAEGTFSRAPGLQPFHLGGFLAAATAGAPVVPMAIRGTRSALRDGEWFPRRLPIEVQIGSPIFASANLQPFAAALQLRDSTRTFIEAHCGEPDPQK
jgi:acyl carrier protein